jgi:head-tail adaptor
MGTLAPATSVNARVHRMAWQNPGPAVPDGDGGSTPTWIDLVPPATSVEIKPATAVDLERIAAGTVLSSNTYIVKGPYHPQITTQTRGLHNGRSFSVTGVSNPEERHVETVCVCVEVVA